MLGVLCSSDPFVCRLRIYRLSSSYSGLGLEPHIVKYTEMGDLLATPDRKIRDNYDEWVHKVMNGVIVV